MKTIKIKIYETKYLNNIRNNRILKVKNYLLELEKEFKELRNED